MVVLLFYLRIGTIPTDYRHFSGYLFQHYASLHSASSQYVAHVIMEHSSFNVLHVTTGASFLCAILHRTKHGNISTSMRSRLSVGSGESHIAVSYMASAVSLTKAPAGFEPASQTQ